MPCRDYQDECRVEYRDGYDPQAKQEIHRLQGRCDELAALLCMVGRARYHKTNIPIEVIEWWEDHMEHDRSAGEPW